VYEPIRTVAGPAVMTEKQSIRTCEPISIASAPKIAARRSMRTSDPSDAKPSARSSSFE